MYKLPDILNAVIISDVLKALKKMPDKCVRCIVTSPPYYGQRDYSTATWQGGDPTCDHSRIGKKGGTTAMALKTSTLAGGKKNQEHAYENSSKNVHKDVCSKCGAVRIDDQIGLEKSPELYIEKLVQVFRECRRILTDDGTCWINIGDSYWGSGGNSGHTEETKNMGRATVKYGATSGYNLWKKHHELKPKDLVGIPWMLAFALRADGWWLRQDIIWSKGSAMPECLDPETTIFIKKNEWISKITLRQLSNMTELPQILSPTGWVQVKKVWQTRKTAMKMEVGKVEYVICSNEHKFPVSSDRRRERTRLECAKDIRHEGYADYLLYCPIDRFLTPTIKTWMGKDLNYDIGFLVGVFAAEGGHDRGFAIKFTIHINELYFRDKIEAACFRLYISISETENKEHNYRCIFIREKWFTDTIDSFVSGNVKTKSLNIELLLNTCQEFRQGILDGYIMGDGSDRKGGGWVVSSASRRLRDSMATLASSIGIITSKGSGEVRDKRTEKEYSHHALWTPYMTKRKSKSGTVGIYQVPPRRRKSLGEEERDMIDIEVEGGLFLIGDGLITHNSIQDRCTKSHEYIFLLSKSSKYYYDHVAIRTPAKNPEDDVRRINAQNLDNKSNPDELKNGLRTRKSGNLQRKDAADRGVPVDHGNCTGNVAGSVPWEGATANKRSVWTVNSKPFPGSHFATFPPELITDPIKAGSSEKGQCSNCGKPWIRVTKKETTMESGSGRAGRTAEELNDSKYDFSAENKNLKLGPTLSFETIDWKPSCNCQADIIPDVILDPFTGAGTTALVAAKLGRNFIGIDLSEKYVKEICIPRLQGELGMFYKAKIIE